ncbi:MAG: UDP-N-acetylmuramoyl-L-alanine--D-glutamate ligase, partial [Thermoanaerobaculia bacterium]|nr:UDP-N-acetylmuramoyl-L-alanine--D-glutamate ligase [Thermoanaerobaculia bacterium]
MTEDGPISRWNRALVYGIGVSGRAATRLLLDRGVEVLAVDARDPGPEELGELSRAPGLELRLGSDPEECPANVDAVVLSPGVPPQRPLVISAREKGLPVLGEVELAFPLTRGPVLAVTGSNGKSTTVALAGAMLEAGGRPVEVCGNIGRPLCAAVTESPGAVFVVELSSFQLESIRDFRPVAAALLNLSPDHLDRYSNLREYRRAKERIFENQGPDDIGVLPADSAFLDAFRPPGRVRYFSPSRPVEEGCFLDDRG